MKKSIKTFAILILLSVIACAFAGCNRLLSIFGAKNNTISLELCRISVEQEVYGYTGEEIKPEVEVKYNGDVLTEGEDYVLSYSDNIEVGTGKITVTGQGNYEGTSVVEFQIAQEVYTYTFKCSYPADCEFVGKTVQQVTDKSQLVPPTVKAKGYTFVDWYILPNKIIDFDDPDTVPSQGAEIWALFGLNNYTINYHLDGGENDPDNPSTYNFESDFALLEPTKNGEKFAGWYLDENFEHRVERILPGYTGNIDLYAKFVNNSYRKINYIVPEGVEFVQYEYIMPETDMTKPEIISADGGQEIVWYADSDCTVKYVFRTMPDEDVTVYGVWEDVLDAGFLDNERDGVIDSYEELVDYIEYICYFNIGIDESKTVSFGYISGATNIKNEISKAADECTYPRIGTLNFTTEYNKATIYQADDLVDAEATVSGTPEEERYEQFGSILYSPANTRSADYDDFAINYVEETYECSTSNQLFYVLSHGYRPLPVKGSQAESVYDDYKQIMRQIVDDDMSDYQKVKTIYEWLVLNVYYDNYVANNGDGTHAYYEYKAFYLEGVLEGSAVCDGISKAFSVMCAIEGIDCVRITGQTANAEVGHAWNKVQIGGEWYLTDATWGNQVVYDSTSKNEYIVYDYLLFSDADRLADGYESNNYTYYETAEGFSSANLYDGIELTVEDVTVDMLIDNAQELSYVLEYVYYVYDGDIANKSIDLMISQRMEFTSVIKEAFRMLLSRRPSGFDFSMPGYLSYDGTQTNGEYTAGTHFVLLFY